MAMSPGSRRGGQVASINMTPMIDVLLVLLIIFMVMQQQLQRGVSVQVPPTSPADGATGPDPLVLEVLPGALYRLNSQPIATGQLRGTLARVFAGRERRVLFVKADERVAYQEVVFAVDESRAAGASIVGLVPRAVE